MEVARSLPKTLGWRLGKMLKVWPSAVSVRRVCIEPPAAV
jgi:hypothetical protein